MNETMSADTFNHEFIMMATPKIRVELQAIYDAGKAFGLNELELSSALGYASSALKHPRVVQIDEINFARQHPETGISFVVQWFWELQNKSR